MCLLSIRKWKWDVKFTLKIVCENGNGFWLPSELFRKIFRFSLSQIGEKWQRTHQILEEKIQLSFNFKYSAQGFENVSGYFIWIPNMRFIWENAYVYHTLHGTFLCEVYCSTIYIVHALRSKDFLHSACYSNSSLIRLFCLFHIQRK